MNITSNPNQSGFDSVSSPASVGRSVVSVEARQKENRSLDGVYAVLHESRFPQAFFLRFLRLHPTC